MNKDNKRTVLGVASRMLTISSWHYRFRAFRASLGSGEVRLFAILEKYVVAIIAALLVSLTVFTVYFVNKASDKALEEVAVRGASELAAAITEFRDFYTVSIVPRARESGMTISPDYLNLPNALPLPATFTHDFGKFLEAQKGTMGVALYSEYPFPQRIERQLDKFQNRALLKLRENPDQPYYAIEQINGQRILRYAQADRLQASCVACHNTWKGSPKTNWKIDDMRGAIEVRYAVQPISISSGERPELLRPITSLALIGAALMLLVLVTVTGLRFALQRNRSLAERQISANKQLTAEVALRSDTEERLRTNELRLKDIFNSVLEGIIVIDRNGLIREVNQAALEMFGYARNELEGRNVSMLMPESVAKHHDGYLEQYMKTGEARLMAAPRNVMGMRQNGEYFPIRIAVQETHSAQQRLFTAVIQDYTVTAMAEQALREAKEAAEAASKLKSEFLTNMSHELRTPLNAILGHAQLMSDEFQNSTDVQSDPKTIREHSSQIMQSGWHLLGLIEEVLDLTKIESGVTNVTLEPVNLAPLIDMCLRQLAGAALKRQVRLLAPHLEDSYWLNADALKLKQVLLNLLSNAIKYNRPEGEVEIAVRSAGNGHVRIDVRDTGRGMTEDQLKQLFQPFVRFIPRGEVIEGSGIGLALSMRLVNMMGGRLTVMSKPGEGSTFSVDLAQTMPPETTAEISHAEQFVQKIATPAATAFSGALHQSTPQANLNEPGSDAPRHRIRVLYIEDTMTNFQVIEAYLNRQGGYEVLHAADGERGLEMAAREVPDIILLDMHLPGMQGIEVKKRLAADQRTLSIPVVALSADAMRADIEHAMQYGFAEYLTKPVRLPRLKEILVNLVGTTSNAGAPLV